MADWNQGFQGATGGAMTGATLGSVVPGLGTGLGALAGGVIGGIAGLWGDNPQSQYRKQLEQLATKYGRMQAPQAGPAQTAGLSGFRQNQAGLVSQLEAMGRGEGPSAAQIQMRRPVPADEASTPAQHSGVP
jgi:phage tail tape-measure protein